MHLKKDPQFLETIIANVGKGASFAIKNELRSLKKAF
jgi:hypothetical protein